ncbi:MAG: hypothetical protein EZS28_024366 [Streblomastix strix]|uniref:Uncharacterized protein n=1 Tax=Streblomastix strix TaxID=222440 RepID=A0A5J4VC28_9EUKA|nr:MAG: hypothetical protein EZS28_024366 [Streblomastix strix]
MPFGLKLAQLVFTKTLEISIKEIRKKYLARWIGQSITKKSETIPSQQQKYLGQIWDIQRMDLLIPQAKRHSMLQLIHRWRQIVIKRKFIQTKNLASQLSKLNFLWTQFQDDGLHSLKLEASLCKAIIKGQHSYTQVQPSAISDVEWWKSKIKLNEGRSILSPSPTQATMTTDASSECQRAVYQTNINKSIVWRVCPRPTFLHSSNKRETRAILCVIRHFEGTFKKEEFHSIQILSDNSVAIRNIIRKKAAPSLAPTPRQTLQLVEKMGIEITTQHIKDIYNTTADHLSRLERAGDYQLTEQALKLAVLNFRVIPTLDEFATRENNQCLQFISTTQDPLAVGTNGLRTAWEKQEVLAHPPIAIIGKSMVDTANQGDVNTINNTGPISISTYPGQINEEKEQEITTRQHRRAPDINKKGEEVYTNLAIAEGLSDEEALEVKKEMSEDLWRTRRAALARLDPFLNEQPGGASCLLGNNASLYIRRALN